MDDLEARIKAGGYDDDIAQGLRDASARGGYVSFTLADMEQSKRNERAGLSSIQRRRFDYAHDAPEPVVEDLRWVHSVTALCGLPYKGLSEGQDLWVKKNGRAQLWVRRGYLPDPMTGDPVLKSIPYGTKARLLFIYLCNEAITNKSPNIEIAPTMSAFLRDLGYEVRGGERGTIRPFMQQMENIIACEMAISYADGEGYSEATFRRPVEQYRLWLPRDDRQGELWRSHVTLSPQFYESLAKHSLPIDIRALRAVSQSSRQMDLIVWLTYRSRAISRPTAIGWEQLQAQFSQTQGNMRSFRQQFNDDIKALQELVGHKLKMIVHPEKGLIVYPMEAVGVVPSLATRGLVPNKLIAKSNEGSRRRTATKKA